MIVHKEYKNMDFLYDQYIIRRKSLMQIGKICNCSNTNILYWLKKFNIPRRTISEGKKGIKFSKEHRKNLSESQKIAQNRLEVRKRNLDDYWELCHECHGLYDKLKFKIKRTVK